MSTKFSLFRPLQTIVIASLLVLSASSLQAKPIPQGVVNINEATAAELMRLPRVGKKTAERIIAYRAERPFKTALALGRVQGIGLKSLRTLKPYLTVDGPTTLTQPISASALRDAHKAKAN